MFLMESNTWAAEFPNQLAKAQLDIIKLLSKLKNRIIRFVLLNESCGETTTSSIYNVHTY